MLCSIWTNVLILDHSEEFIETILIRDVQHKSFQIYKQDSGTYIMKIRFSKIVQMKQPK